MDSDELAAYRSELASVDAKLAQDAVDKLGDEMKKELQSRRDDLIELISLMESEEGEEGVAITKPDEEEDPEEKSTSLEDDLSDLIGMRCRAPFPGGYEVVLDKHAAIVLGVDGIDPDRGVTLTVLYSHPLINAMLPCPHFLADTCRFGEKCKFSHGTAVAASELEDYEEPDFSEVKSGSPVLVSVQPLWEVGRVTAKDGDQLAVRILRTGAEVSSTVANVVPIDGEIEVVEEQKGDEKEEFSEQKGEECGRVKKDDIGNWEGGGIGLRLMQKMGYKKGEGLGKHSDGIVHAIQARICPKGASLDTLMEKKGKRRVVDGVARERLRGTKPNNEAEQSIFSFLNRKLQEPLDKEQALEEMEWKDVMSGSVSLGAHSIDNEKKIKDLKSKRQKLSDGLRRNAKDKETVSRLSLQLAAVDKDLERLEGKKHKISEEMDKRAKRKKDIF